MECPGACGKGRSKERPTDPLPRVEVGRVRQGDIRLRREPIGDFAHFGGDPLEAVAIGDEQRTDEENSQTEFSHGGSIPRF